MDRDGVLEILKEMECLDRDEMDMKDGGAEVVEGALSFGQGFEKYPGPGRGVGSRDAALESTPEKSSCQTPCGCSPFQWPGHEEVGWSGIWWL